MDLKALGPVVGALLNAGAPTISTALQMAAGEIPVIGGLIGPLAGLAAPRVISMIAGQLGVNEPDASPEEVADTVVKTINADPDGAKAKLATLESEHSFTLSSRDKDNTDQAQQIELLKIDTNAGGWLARNWRPLVAMGLGIFLGLQLVLPYLVWAMQSAGLHPAPLPEPRFDVTVAMLTGLLGLGAMRSFDKVQGTAAGQTKVLTRAR